MTTGTQKSPIDQGFMERMVNKNGKSSQTFVFDSITDYHSNIVLNFCIKKMPAHIEWPVHALLFSLQVRTDFLNSAHDNSSDKDDLTEVKIYKVHAF